MVQQTLPLIGLALLLALVGVAVLTHPRVLDREASREARRSGLPRTPDLEPWLTRRLRSAAAVTVAGAVTGTALAVTGVVTRGDDPPDVVWLPLLLVALGAASGQALAVLLATLVRTATARRSRSPRVARVRAVTLSDYLPRRSWAPGLLLTAAALGAGVLALVTAGPDTPTVALALLPAALLLCARLLAGAVATAPQAASGPVLLAWDDLLRVRELRTVASVPVHAGTVCTLLLTGAAVAALPDDDGARLLGGAALVVLVGVYLAAVVAARRPDPYGQVRSRLWDTAEPAAPGVVADRAHR